MITSALLRQDKKEENQNWFNMLLNTVKEKIGLQQKCGIYNGQITQLLNLLKSISTTSMPDNFFWKFTKLKETVAVFAEVKNFQGLVSDFQNVYTEFRKSNGEISDGINYPIFLKNDRKAIESFCLLHYKRCWAGFIAGQQDAFKVSANLPDREARMQRLLEKFTKSFTAMKRHITDLTSLDEIKAGFQKQLKKMEEEFIFLN